MTWFGSSGGDLGPYSMRLIAELTYFFKNVRLPDHLEDESASKFRRHFISLKISASGSFSFSSAFSTTGYISSLGVSPSPFGSSIFESWTTTLL